MFDVYAYSKLETFINCFYLFGNGAANIKK